MPPPAKSSGMTNREFSLFSQFIESTCGIRMPDSKKLMLESRLQKRLKHLGIGTFQEYYDYLVSKQGLRDELVSMIDVVTTNKTDFFREAAHFTYLTESVLPRIPKIEQQNGIKVWSAGCSSGEEPYTLAMTLSEFARNNLGFRYSILATDICTEVLKSAHRGIYDEEKIAPIPQLLKKRYLLRSKDRSRCIVRVCPELRSKVTFRRLNFMDETFDVESPFRIIFCRNVIIYFDRETQEVLLNKFCRHLLPGGYLFLGHSETLNGLNVPLVQVNSTVYRKLA
ncbi:MAG: chemotaxis protein CheR [Deltaproteobacteria bacterium]|nr:chemotaxis protein CheR [Deltaproteobacteria bacterium]TLN02967.1 MAG: chemotaxis protein CheR [bacterium]